MRIKGASGTLSWAQPADGSMSPLIIVEAPVFKQAKKENTEKISGLFSQQLSSVLPEQSGNEEMRGFNPQAIGLAAGVEMRKQEVDTNLSVWRSRPE